MAENFVFFIVYIAEALIAYTYFNDNYNVKRKSSVSLLIAFGLYSLGFCASIITGNNYIINIAIFFIVNLIYSKLSFNISVKSALLHSSILLAIMSLTEIIVEAGASFLLTIPIDAYKNSLSALVILGTIDKILYLIVCKLISFLFSYKKNHMPFNVERNFALFLYPFITSIMMVAFSYTSAMYNFSKKINLVFATISVLSLVFCCLIFIINQKIQQQESELLELQSEKQKTEINQSFYELLEKKNEEQRVMVHDIKHHISAINSMENIEDIKKYITKISPEFNEYQYIGKTKNKMLDLILSKYLHLCKTNHIHFIVDTRSSNLSFIEDNDLTSLIGNLLDNAVEAAKDAENAVIRFTTKRENNFDIISVVNSSSHSPKSKGETLFTTKADSSFHGYGTKSIEKTAKKYGGICHWEYDENDKTFHFNIVFNK